MARGRQYAHGAADLARCRCSIRRRRDAYARGHRLQRGRWRLRRRPRPDRRGSKKFSRPRRALTNCLDIPDRVRRWFGWRTSPVLIQPSLTPPCSTSSRAPRGSLFFGLCRRDLRALGGPGRRAHAGAVRRPNAPLASATPRLTATIPTIVAGSGISPRMRTARRAAMAGVKALKAAARVGPSRLTATA